MKKISDHPSATDRNSAPGSYSWGVKILSLGLFLYATIAFLNESVFHQFRQPDGSFPFWLSHWTEYFIIVLCGILRTAVEKNPYTRKRLAVLTFNVGILWWILPRYLRLPEPHLGTLAEPPMFPHLHTPGTLSFFVVLGLIFLFGRRIICGWCCPCVGIRETVGFPFRINTLRTESSRRYYRHIKWFFFALYLVSTALIIFYSPYAVDFHTVFNILIVFPYFATLLLAPILGNRSYCRFVCPFGATFGLLNRVGLYGIKLDKEKCTRCGLCEEVCDMGIPVWTQGMEHGKIVTIEECMGCARCLSSCTNNALQMEDAKNLLIPGIRQDNTYFAGRVKTDRET